MWPFKKKPKMVYETTFNYGDDTTGYSPKTIRTKTPPRIQESFMLFDLEDDNGNNAISGFRTELMFKLEIKRVINE